MCDKNGISGGEGVRFGSQFLENPEGRGGGHRKKIPSMGGYGYFLKLHNSFRKGERKIEK